MIKKFAGFAVNDDAAGPWLLGLGKILINFGAIEALTYLWIDHLAGNQTECDQALKMNFARRVDRILSLLSDSEASETIRVQAKVAWDKARELGKIRNDLAHNPILFGWRGRPA